MCENTGKADVRRYVNTKFNGNILSNKYRVFCLFELSAAVELKYFFK